MINGLAARNVHFFIDGTNPALLPLVGDGLLPAYIDGKQKPMTDTAVPLVGTQDDGGPYGATFDAINIWDLLVKWRSTPIATLSLNTQRDRRVGQDRKSTRLNSSHQIISYAVF